MSLENKTHACQKWSQNEGGIMEEYRTSIASEGENYLQTIDFARIKNFEHIDTHQGDTSYAKSPVHDINPNESTLVNPSNVTRMKSSNTPQWSFALVVEMKDYPRGSV